MYVLVYFYNIRSRFSLSYHLKEIMLFFNYVKTTVFISLKLLIVMTVKVYFFPHFTAVGTTINDQ